MVSHMVFGRNMNPVWCDTPESTKRFLKQRLEQDPKADLFYVRVWRKDKLTFITVLEYLERDYPGGNS